MSTYVDDPLSTEDDEGKIHIMAEYLLGRYVGRDFGVPGTLVGVKIQVTEESIPLEASISRKGIVIEGIGSMDARRVHDPFDLSAKRDGEEERHEETSTSGVVEEYHQIVMSLCKQYQEGTAV